jgi:uncharacterized membrane protein
MAEAKGPTPKHKETVVVSDAQRKHERLTLFLFLEGFAAIIAGMVLISEFLSQGKANDTVLYIVGGLVGIFAIGFLATLLIRKASDKKTA